MYNFGMKSKLALILLTVLLSSASPALADGMGPEDYYRIGADFMLAGRYEGALAAFGNAVRTDPKFIRGWMGEGTALNALGRYEEALSAYDKAIEADPKNTEAWTKKGVDLYLLWRHDEALDAFGKAIDSGKMTKDGYKYRGLTLKVLKRPEEALEMLDRAAALDRNDTAVLAARAEILQALGRYRQAADVYGILARAEPDNARARFNRGSAFDQLGKYEEAVAALKVDPKYVTAMINLGYALVRTGRAADAVKVSERAVAAEPGSRPAKINLALALIRLNTGDDSKRAVEILNGLLAEDASDDYAPYALALMGEKTSMIALVRKKVAADPSLKAEYLQAVEFDAYRYDPAFLEIVGDGR